MISNDYDLPLIGESVESIRDEVVLKRKLIPSRIVSSEALSMQMNESLNPYQTLVQALGYLSADGRPTPAQIIFTHKTLRDSINQFKLQPGFINSTLIYENLADKFEQNPFQTMSSFTGEEWKAYLSAPLDTFAYLDTKRFKNNQERYFYSAMGLVKSEHVALWLNTESALDLDESVDGYVAEICEQYRELLWGEQYFSAGIKPIRVIMDDIENTPGFTGFPLTDSWL